MASKKEKVRVAIIGVGNCASSLVQGIQFYKDTPDDAHVPGIMHTRLAGYHIRDIEFTLGIKSSPLTSSIMRILRFSRDRKGVMRSASKATRRNGTPRPRV